MLGLNIEFEDDETLSLEVEMISRQPTQFFNLAPTKDQDAFVLSAMVGRLEVKRVDRS